MAIRHVAEPMVAAGVRVDAMRACGGPARSETWNQIKADVTMPEYASWGSQERMPTNIEAAYRALGGRV